MVMKAKKASRGKMPPVDTRGRKIGKRAHRVPVTDGLVLLSGEERTMLREIAARAHANGKGVTAFDRAMALEVGEVDFARAGEMQSFAMSFSQARRRGNTDGRKFSYGHAPLMFKLSDSTTPKYASVLWIMRTK